MGPRAAGIVLVLALAAAFAAPVLALDVVTYNLLQYNTSSAPSRNPHHRTVMAALNPDIIICQELNANSAADSFLTNVLNVVQPGEWSRTAWAPVGFGEGMAFFFKPAKVSMTNFLAFSVGGTRSVCRAVAQPAGYGLGSRFILYSVHFKAGQTASDTADRRVECTNLRTTLNLVQGGFDHMLVGGDTNFYGSWEGGYIRLTEDQLDNDGRMFDSATLPGTWNQSAYRAYHSQSPCLSGCIGSGGGLDDRFDFWLASGPMVDGEGLSVVANTVTPYGNDGNHYNQSVDAGTNTAVPAAVATALKFASDHLPVRVTVQVPSKVSVQDTLDLDKAIVSGALSGPLNIYNVAATPADDLDFTMTGTDVSVSPGPFVAQPGLFATVYPALDTSTWGDKVGTATIHSDDPDTPDQDVTVIGRVLRRADPSLDSLAVLLSAPLDFGEHEPGGFTDQDLKVFNLGYDAYQAGIQFYEAQITGGGGRFSIAGGFSPILVGGTHAFPVHFNDVGAPLDSTYTATLTLRSYDEPYEGANLLPDLVVSLSARPSSGTTGVPGGTPAALSFSPPRPNPFNGGTRLGFDLPTAARVSLAVYDASGRRVRSLASGTMEAGRYEYAWHGDDDAGHRVAAGLYFVRFDTPGLRRVARVISLP